MAAPTDAPIAVSTALRATLTGPRQPTVVVGSPAGAVYLRTAAGELVAVLAPTAARLPMGAVVGDRDALRSPPEPGETGQVGDGWIEVGRLSARVVRWWNPRPALPPRRTTWLAANHAAAARGCDEAATGLPAPVLRATLPALAAALHAADIATAVHAATALIGLGPGLTPAGDDVLVGLLSALVCLGHPGSDRLAAGVVETATGRTTDLSLALLRHARVGNCIGEVGTLLQALAGVGDVDTAHERLLAVGHSSGAALCVGVGVGAEVALGGAGPR